MVYVLVGWPNRLLKILKHCLDQNRSATQLLVQFSKSKDSKDRIENNYHLFNA